MIKRFLKKLIFKHSKLYYFFSIVYSYFTNYSGRRRYVSYGNKNPDKTFYLIRPRTNNVEGLMSLFLEVCKKLNYANEMGYIPYVDMKNYQTQYSFGNDNVWERYFSQPSSYNIEEIYKSKNVILSGYSFINYKSDLFSYKVFFDKSILQLSYSSIFSKIKFTSEVNSLVNKEAIRIGAVDSLGVYIRGTDYVKLKPTGEHVQPTTQQLIDKINEFIKLYNIESIYLVTEDFNIYTILEKNFKAKLKTVSFDSFIDKYDGKTFLSKSNVFKDNPYMTGLNYLVKLIVLSRCKYFIGSITKGSIFAYIYNNDGFEDEYIFDLGVY